MLTSSGIGQWESVNLSQPGATSGEILANLENHEEEIANLDENVIFIAGAGGNDLRDLWSTQQAVDNLDKIRVTPHHPAALPIAAKYLHIVTQGYARNIGKILKTIHRIDAKRVRNGMSRIGAAIITVPHDFGLVPHIVVESLDCDKDLRDDINLQSEDSSSKLASFASYTLRFLTNLEVIRHRKKAKPKYPIAMGDPIGLEALCNDVHLTDKGQKAFANKLYTLFYPKTTSSGEALFL